jgi:hypothetical protein
MLDSLIIAEILKKEHENYLKDSVRVISENGEEDEALSSVVLMGELKIENLDTSF